MSNLDPVTGQPAAPPISHPPATATQPSGTGDDAKAKASEAADQARQRASAASGAVGEHAGQVTESAKAHAAEVTGEARRQASQVIDQGRTQLKDQADQQAGRAAEALQGFSQQLEAMARGERPPEGPLADLVQEGAQRIGALAESLRAGGVEGALRDAQRFARRRPGMFLATAFGAGLVAGRLVRNTDTSHLTGSQDDGGSLTSGSTGVSPGAQLEPSRTEVPAPVTTGVGAGTRTGTSSAGLPGAPTLPDADPLVTGDPTGLQGGPR